MWARYSVFMFTTYCIYASQLYEAMVTVLLDLGPVLKEFLVSAEFRERLT